MRHFNYHPNGGPFPGVCAMCGIDRDLWALGFDHPRGGDAMACSRCIGELAENIGWTLKQPLLDIIDRKNAEIDELSTMLDQVPNHTEGLINGVRTLITDFVFAISNSSHPAGSLLVRGDETDSVGNVEGDQPADNSNQASVESTSVEGSTSIPADSVRNRPGRPRKS